MDSSLWKPDLVVSLTYHCNANCEYCYSKGLKKDMPNHITFENFKRIVQWLKKQGRNKIIVFGGEPTIHPEFKNILQYCEDEDMEIGVLTNGLFKKDISDMLAKDFVKIISFNYNPPFLYKKNDWELLNKNINILAKKGAKVELRGNLQDYYRNYDYIIKKAKNYGLKIRFGITLKGVDNKYWSFEDRENIKSCLLRFVKKMKANKVYGFLTGPIPRCLFSNSEWNFLKKYAHARSRCYVTDFKAKKGKNLKFDSGCRVVNPDLSVFGCSPIFNQKANNLLDFWDVFELYDYFHHNLINLQWEKHLYEGCKKCKLFRSRVCQGACLGAKI